MKNTVLSSFSLLGSVASSQAALISFANQEIPIPTTFQGVYIDVETGTTSASAALGADINFFFGGEGIGNDADSVAVAPSLQFARSGTNNLDPAVSSNISDVLGIGTIVVSTGYGGSGSPNDHIGVAPTQFEDGVRTYLGFTLDIGGNTHYGFFDLTLTDNSAGGVVHGWTYEDQPNTPITVTAVPEPTTGLLLALTLAGLGMRRRRP